MTLDTREATVFVLSRMKVVHLVLRDDIPVGYLPTQATAAAYAARLALQKKNMLPKDSWSETCIEQQDHELVVMRRSLGLVYNSTFIPYHCVKYVPLDVLDISDIIVPDIETCIDDDETDSDSDSDSDSESDSESEEK